MHFGVGLPEAAFEHCLLSSRGVRTVEEAFDIRGLIACRGCLLEECCHMGEGICVCWVPGQVVMFCGVGNDLMFRGGNVCRRVSAGSNRRGRRHWCAHSHRIGSPHRNQRILALGACHLGTRVRSRRPVTVRQVQACRCHR